MKMKKLLSVLLVGALCGSIFAGCGNSAKENDVTEESSETASDEEDGFSGFDELVEIDMYGMTLFSDSGLEEVVDAINEISEKEINVHVNYTCMDVSTYMQQIGLMLSGGESFDLVQCTPMPTVSFATMQSQNELMDITEYLDEYAPDMLSLMEEYLPATTVDGSVYAVPCYRMFNSGEYLCMRKDVLDYLGLTEQAEAISSWSDFEEILLAVEAAQDSLPEDLQTNAMIVNSDSQGNVINPVYANTAADEFADNYGFDTLGDQTKMIYVDEDGNVGCYFATDDYRASLERVARWYEEGLVYKDAATSDDQGETLLANGVAFSFSVQGETGVEIIKAAATGHELVCVKYCDIPVQTSNGSQFAWAVPVTAENPEAAVAFLNLMYTNAEIENLFVYGIEGRDYEVNEEGEAVYLEDLEYQNSDFLFGNLYLSYPAEGMGGNFREEGLEALEAAEVSDYYGFTINTNEISNELTAISTVLTKYEPGLESGSMDISQLDVMLEEMESAGLQTVLDFYQAAMDEWLAEQ